MRDACGGDMQAGFHAPVWCGVSKMTLDLAPRTVIGHEGGVGQGPVTAAQPDRGPGRGTSVGLGAADDMHGVRTRLGEYVPLGQAGCAVPLDGGLCERVHREVLRIALGAIRAPGPPPRRGPRIGASQRRLLPQRGHEG